MDFTGAARRRSPQAFADAARMLGCEVAAFQAVVDVEANGIGFDNHGRPKALYEPHKFWKHATKAQREKAAKQGLAYPKWKPRNYPKDSYPRIAAAMQINADAALKATSWGLPQILGENYELAGYDSAEQMVEAFCAGEDAQIAAMAHFIKSTGLDRHLRSKNWAKLAEGYNGKAYAEHGYDRKLLIAYRKRAAAAPALFMLSIEDVEDPHVEQAPTWNAPVDEEHAEIIDHDPRDDREKVASVQQRLRDLGYFEVGKVDGDRLGRTQDAILAFRRANNLPLTTEIDDELLTALSKAAPRQIGTDRANATADDLRAEGSETIGILDRAKGWAGKLFGFGSSGGVIAVMTERTSQVTGAKQALGKLGISADMWALILIAAVCLLVLSGIGLFVWHIAHRLEEKRVADYRMGKNT